VNESGLAAGKPPAAFNCNLPEPDLPGGRRKLTLAGNAIAPQVSFLDPPRTHPGGHYQSLAKLFYLPPSRLL
jgi:hypothetical protein